ncbi:hypothetical protein DFP72DRAFT_924228 [Ephemerocybe angulata]|uniref:Uncharacterized protein n=1 Tax=Ephemerocybe angulata TaxID=980116 RepID=A0A8H6LVT8_9AGAR|nr:hypothetical protein DFP72DRAFT_924228 [Tulosesus angulatus]
MSQPSATNDQPFVEGKVDPPQPFPGFDPKGYTPDSPGGEGEIGAAFGDILYQIWRDNLGSVALDDAARGRFTQGLVSSLRKIWPMFNFVIVCTAHARAFDGAEGKDWGMGHGDLPTSFAGTIGYSIYYLRSGVFMLQGDGGYQNWAWIGSGKANGDGRIVLFT